MVTCDVFEYKNLIVITGGLNSNTSKLLHKPKNFIGICPS